MISKAVRTWQTMVNRKPCMFWTRNKQQDKAVVQHAKYTGMITPRKHSSQLLGVVIGAASKKAPQLIDMLRHEGIYHDVFFIDDFMALDAFPRLAMFVSPVTFKGKAHGNGMARFKAHVEAGNGVIAIGRIPQLEAMLGIEYQLPDFPFPAGGRLEDSLGEGYIHPASSAIEASLPASWWPLHAFGCVPLATDGATVLATYRAVHGDGDPRPAITRAMVGKGCAVQVAVDLAYTARHVQEGRYVDQDGIPPPDGLSPIDDGILKCEDGLVLDWTRDRRPVSPTCKVAAFMVPVADACRKILMATIEIVADACVIPATRAWYWPGGAPFVALVSHDSDGNDDTLARHLLAEVGRAGIHTTWCIEAPGYSKALCAQIQAEGHELAFHFDAIAYPKGKQQDAAGMARLFSRDMLEQQLDEVRENSGCAALYSNKNHYTRWAGRAQFFEWCESLGLRVDQSKGPSKCGTLGFPFGSCHPWQAVRDDGTLIGCCEISFQSQDFGLQGPADTIDEILDAVKLANGVAHVIFHPAHSRKDLVNKSMHEFITKAKQLGGAFMTSKQIAEWTFDRKHMIATGGATMAGLVIHVRDPGKHAWEPASTRGA